MPRMILSDGGEFRVLKIAYGTGEVHYLHGAPKLFFTLWRMQPEWMQKVLPYPWNGLSAEVPGGTATGISIWWAWYEPATHKAELGPSGDVIVTMDSGESVNLGWPNPVDEYRQILLTNPSRDSQWLHYFVPVNELEHPVEFTIRNPAWRR